jgi:predicted DNA-binding transcriptional regulator YafY
MPPVSKARHFEIVTAALALAEERGAVPLTEAASIVGVSCDELRTLLEPVLFLEFRRADSTIVDATRAFLLDEHDVLQVDLGNWLRDLSSSPPSEDAALRLLISATAYLASAPRRSAELDAAVEKLRQLVAMEMVLPVEHPPCLDVARSALRGCRSLQFRYVKWKDDHATTREVLPYDLYCKWGHWYVYGPEVTEEVPKHFRLDRMTDARLGAIMFDLPEPSDLPDWLDMSAVERTVTVRAPRAVLDTLPQPHTLGEIRACSDGRVEVRITVAGDRQLDHLLLSLGPDASVSEPEYASRRRTLAAAALANTNATPRG